MLNVSWYGCENEAVKSPEKAAVSPVIASISLPSTVKLAVDNIAPLLEGPLARLYGAPGKVEVWPAPAAAKQLVEECPPGRSLSNVKEIFGHRQK